MRAWWWILITAHLVWGNPERFKDDNRNTISINTNQKNSVSEDKLYTSFILTPKTFYTRIRRSSSEGDEREKKQLRFHSWGGKRYSDEEEDIGDNSDTEANMDFNEPDNEELMTDLSSYPLTNTSHLESDDLGVHFREAFTKRIKSSPAFSSWGGKRDPEMLNDLSKRSNHYSPIIQQSFLDSKLEQSRKRYPSFSSWAGKRAVAFNNWGGKGDHSKDKTGFNDDIGNQANLNNRNTEVYTGLNSNGLGSEINLNFDNDPGTKNGGENPTSKRASAFNSWGGKRTSDDNLVMMKKPASFNSWAAKRTAAFNSWAGKKAAAFNSWAGKRAAAFNSWGGKRSAAFNSWGGKRAAAFNSWGGKRAAAFNSWGGKRNVDKLNENPKFEYPIWTSNRALYSVTFPMMNNQDKNIKDKTSNSLDVVDKSNSNNGYVFKNIAADNDSDRTKEDTLKNNFYLLFIDKKFKNIDFDELKKYVKESNPKTTESHEHSSHFVKRIRPSFTSWAGKRSPLFSSWYGGKIPTVLLTSGKRRPAFSSWGGKRSEHIKPASLNCQQENTYNRGANLQKPEEVQTEELSSPGEKTYTRKKRDLECNYDKDTSALTIERDKRASGNFLKNRVFSRMMLQSWPMAFQSMSHGNDFFAWGGKRSIDGAALR